MSLTQAVALPALVSLGATQAVWLLAVLVVAALVEPQTAQLANRCVETAAWIPPPTPPTAVRATMPAAPGKTAKRGAAGASLV